jgi:hypothetical protein
MKNLVKFLAATAATVMMFGLGVHKADASGIDFNIGVNLGIPVVTASAYRPAPVYAHQPVRVYNVREVRYTDFHGQRPGAYRYDRMRHDQGRHRGWDNDNRGWNRN